MNKCINYVFFFFFFFSSCKLFSQIVYQIENENLEINNHVQIFKDSTNKLTLEDIIKIDDFKPSLNNVPNLGISKFTFWLKIPIKNSSQDEHFLIDVSQPTIDFIDYYYPDENNIYQHIEMGGHFPFNTRKYDDPDYIFDLHIPLTQTKIVYVKIRSKVSIQLPIKIGIERNILMQIKNKSILFGLYFGIMLVMILYNFFIFLSVKDKSYLYYVIYIISVLLTQASFQGYTFQFLWPNYPFITHYAFFIVSCMSGITGMMFMKLFLQIKSHNVLINRVSYFLYACYFLSACFLVLQDFKTSWKVLEISAMLVSVYMLVTPIIILKNGYKPAKFFIIAWSIFLIGIFIYVLKDLELLPFNNFTRYTMPIGSALETILLSFALANRINILKKEKEQSQATAVDALQQNEKLITEQNVMLEQQVEERTIELNNTLIHLKDTQTQMVNVEKMASLGQLTAGIAHEINNPINFVSANVKPLKLDIDDILELVKKYEKIPITEDSRETLKAIEEYKRKIDFDYLKKEIESLLTGIEDGAKRTAEIVSGLRNFSRLDEGDIKMVNINEGIESTLILIKNTIPDNVKVSVDLGDISFIECFPGKLNQVFMNLLSNAIYALNKKQSTNKQLIIKTYEENDCINVLIEDNGIGMTEETKANIFDPFYTTKAIGEGTGLGMSIVFKILESHHAKIKIESEIGVGTKILLILNKKIKILQST